MPKELNDINKPPRWDLTNLYSGIDGDDLVEDKALAEQMATEFAENYDERVMYLTGKELGAAIAEYEQIIDIRKRIDHYSELLISEDIANYPKIEPIIAWLKTIDDKIGFFEGEIIEMKERTLMSKMAAPETAKYAAWIGVIRADKSYFLDQDLEDYIGKTWDAHHGNWQRLFHETVSGLRFEIDGKKVTADEIESVIGSNDMEKRKKARVEAARVLKENSVLMGSILNNLMKDKEINDRWRGYTRPDHETNSGNQIDDEIVDILFDTVKDSYKRISHRYYAWKAKKQNTSLLKPHQVLAHAQSVSDDDISWDDAQKTVLRAFKNFSSQMSRIAKKLMDDGHIDAEPRPGKYAGAFAMSTGAGALPFVMMAYQGDWDDVVTLAHELGHACHFALAEKKHGTLLTEMPDTIAETASVFGEMLVFHDLLQNETDPDVRRQMLEEKLAGMMGTSLKQIAYYDFEKKIHTKRKTQELSAEEISDIWIETLRDYYGSSVEFDDYDRYYWAWVPHFFDSPFYVYSYAFGDCLVNALYQAYEESDDKEAFAETYIDMLESGTTKDVQEMLGMFDMDPEDPAFWEKGLSLIEQYMDILESLDNNGPVNDNKLNDNAANGGRDRPAAPAPGPGLRQSIKPPGL